MTDRARRVRPPRRDSRAIRPSARGIAASRFAGSFAPQHPPAASASASPPTPPPRVRARARPPRRRSRCSSEPHSRSPLLARARRRERGAPRPRTRPASVRVSRRARPSAPREPWDGPLLARVAPSSVEVCTRAADDSTPAPNPACPRALASRRDRADGARSRPTRWSDVVPRPRRRRQGRDDLPQCSLDASGPIPERTNPSSLAQPSSSGIPPAGATRSFLAAPRVSAAESTCPATPRARRPAHARTFGRDLSHQAIPARHFASSDLIELHVVTRSSLSVLYAAPAASDPRPNRPRPSARGDPPDPLPAPRVTEAVAAAGDHGGTSRRRAPSELRGRSRTPRRRSRRRIAPRRDRQRSTIVAKTMSSCARAHQRVPAAARSTACAAAAWFVARSRRARRGQAKRPGPGVRLVPAAPRRGRRFSAPVHAHARPTDASWAVLRLARTQLTASAHLGRRRRSTLGLQQFENSDPFLRRAHSAPRTIYPDLPAVSDSKNEPCSEWRDSSRAPQVHRLAVARSGSG